MKTYNKRYDVCLIASFIFSRYDISRLYRMNSISVNGRRNDWRERQKKIVPKEIIWNESQNEINDVTMVTAMTTVAPRERKTFIQWRNRIFLNVSNGRIANAYAQQTTLTNISIFYLFFHFQQAEICSCLHAKCQPNATLIFIWVAMRINYEMHTCNRIVFITTKQKWILWIRMLQIKWISLAAESKYKMKKKRKRKTL